MRATQLAYISAVALLLSSTAFSAEKLVVKLFVRAVKQDGPVQVVGFKFPNSGPGLVHAGADDSGLCQTGGSCPKVVLRNNSDKQVTHVEVEGLYGDPSATQG